MKPVGPEIHKIRTTQQLTLDQVAYAAGITKKELQVIEKKDKPTKDEIKKVCAAMKVDRKVLMLFCLEPKDIHASQRTAWKGLSPVVKKLAKDELLKKKIKK